MEHLEEQVILPDVPTTSGILELLYSVWRDPVVSPVQFLVVSISAADTITSESLAVTVTSRSTRPPGLTQLIHMRSIPPVCR